MYTLLSERRLRWLGHVYRREDGRIPKDILYGELAAGQRGLGQPQLRYKDVCKRHESTEHQHKFLGGSRSQSHQLEKHASKKLQTGEENLSAKAAEK